ncbi:MAG: FtsB family cell division protein [Gemmatimonadales bacterium]
MTPRRWLFVGALVLAVLFGIQAGEYSTLDWLALRKEARLEAAKVTELQRVVDSLTRYAQRVETDIELQERIAREQHGMLRPGEHAFILEEVPEAPRR